MTFILFLLISLLEVAILFFILKNGKPKKVYTYPLSFTEGFGPKQEKAFVSAQFFIFYKDFMNAIYIQFEHTLLKTHSVLDDKKVQCLIEPVEYHKNFYYLSKSISTALQNIEYSIVIYKDKIENYQSYRETPKVYILFKNQEDFKRFKRKIEI